MHPVKQWEKKTKKNSLLKIVKFPEDHSLTLYMCQCPGKILNSQDFKDSGSGQKETATFLKNA